jgi:uncharacterized membrane protein
MPRWHISALAAIIAVAAALRIHDLTLGGLWMDELWASTYTQLGLKDLLVAVIRFDVHPPVYYMQMKFWSVLFGRSDTALLANSVVWSLLTVLVVHFAASRILSPVVGLLAAALVSVSGSEVYYGQELRMYAMIGALTPTAWYLAERYGREPNWGRAAGLIAMLIPLALAHGASVVPISCVMIYLALRLGIRASLRPQHLIVFAAAGLVTLPAMVNSMFRGVSHIQGPSAEIIGATLAGWLFGYYPPLASWVIAFGAIIVISATVIALLHRSARWTVCAFVVWPVVFVVAVSVALRPIWIARLMAFCAPFACIALSVTLLHLSSWQRILAVPAGVAIIAMMTVISLGQDGDGRKMEYREAAAFLRQNAQAGDLILVPEYVTFWGIARYFAGPSWGNLLKIQDPIRPGTSRAWDPIYARLGPGWLSWLNLMPDRRVIEAHGNRLMIGHSPDPAMREPRRIWIVGSGLLHPEDLDLCSPISRGMTQFRGIAVYAWDCVGSSSSGGPALPNDQR